MKNWAIILGASSGIGAACAKSLAKKGINIYGIYLRKKQNDIDIIKQDLESFGVDVIFKKGNASNEDAINQSINELLGLKILYHK